MKIGSSKKFLNTLSKKTNAFYLYFKAKFRVIQTMINTNN